MNSHELIQIIFILMIGTLRLSGAAGKNGLGRADEVDCSQGQCHFCGKVCEKYEGLEANTCRDVNEACCEKGQPCKPFTCDKKSCSYCFPSKNCSEVIGTSKHELCKFSREKCCEQLDCDYDCDHSFCPYCSKDCDLLGSLGKGRADEAYQCRVIQGKGCCKDPELGCPLPTAFHCEARFCKEYCQRDCDILKEIVNPTEAYECLLTQTKNGCCDQLKCPPSNQPQGRSASEGGSSGGGGSPSCPGPAESTCASLHCDKKCEIFKEISVDLIYSCMESDKNGCCKDKDCPTLTDAHCKDSSCLYCNKYSKKECLKLNQTEEIYKCLSFHDKDCFGFCEQEQLDLNCPAPFNCSDKSCSFCSKSNPPVSVSNNETNCTFKADDFCYFSQRKCCGNGNESYCHVKNTIDLNCADEDACSYCDTGNKTCEEYYTFPKRCTQSKEKCCKEGQSCNVTEDEEYSMILPVWGIVLLILFFLLAGIIIGFFLLPKILNLFKGFKKGKTPKVENNGPLSTDVIRPEVADASIEIQHGVAKTSLIVA